MNNQFLELDQVYELIKLWEGMRQLDRHLELLPKRVSTGHDLSCCTHSLMEMFRSRIDAEGRKLELSAKPNR